MDNTRSEASTFNEMYGRQLDKIIVNIDYISTTGEVLRCRNTIPMQSYQDNPEVLEYAARDAAKQFSRELEIELDTLRYAPKVKTDQMIYNEIRDNYYKESDRFRT